MKKVEPRDAFSRDVLEFDGIRGLLRGFLSSPLSEPRLAALEPHTRLDEIRRALERVGEARDFLRTVPRPRLDPLEDPQPILERVEPWPRDGAKRSEEHTSALQSLAYLVWRLL